MNKTELLCKILAIELELIEVRFKKLEEIGIFSEVADNQAEQQVSQAYCNRCRKLTDVNFNKDKTKGFCDDCGVLTVQRVILSEAKFL